MPGGWTKLDNEALKRIGRLGPVPLAVFVLLRMHADAGGLCWPSIKTLAELLGCSENRIREALTKLEKAEVLTIERSKGRLSNRFRLVDNEQKPESATLQKLKSNPSKTEGYPFRNRRVNPSKTEGEQDTDNQTHRTRPKEPRAGKPAEVVSIPPEIDSPEFRAVWSRWVAYRKQLKKPLTVATQEAQLKKHATAGQSEFIAMIEQSISQGWQGLFERRQSIGQSKRRSFEPGPGQRHPADTAARSKPGDF